MESGREERAENIKKFRETFGQLILAYNEEKPGGKLGKQLKAVTEHYGKVFNKQKGGRLPAEYYELVNEIREQFGAKPLEPKSKTA
jgi:hypothetical protein